MDGVTSAVIRKMLIFALDGSINEYKPYLYLAELQRNF